MRAGFICNASGWESGVGGGGKDGFFGRGTDGVSSTLGAGAGVGKPASLGGDGGGRAGVMSSEARSRSGGDASASDESSGKSVGRRGVPGDKRFEIGSRRNIGKNLICI